MQKKNCPGRGGGGSATAKNIREVTWPSLIRSGGGGRKQKVYTYFMNSNRNTNFKKTPEE